MFESNDDVDLDDEFLSGIFENEEEHFTSAFSSRVTGESTEHHQQQKTFGLSLERTVPTKSYTVNKVLESNNHELANDSQNHFLHSGGVFHGNKENKRKYESPSAPLRSKRERKFPGPAGLLPDRKSSRSTPLKLDSLLEADKSPPRSTHDELCSQGKCSGSILEEEPWQNLLRDLGADRHILDIVNVASVKRKAAARCFVGRKLSFLAAILHHLDLSSPDPCIILRDSTGEIHGTLHRDVWDQFAGELVVGSVLVVRNVGLLSTGISSRRHYLNITANNLATIYSANPDKSGMTRLHSFTSQDFIQTIENWRTLVSPSHGVGSPASIGSPSLFNSLNSSLANSPLQSPSDLNSGAFCNNVSMSKVNLRLLRTAPLSNMKTTIPQSIQSAIKMPSAASQHPGFINPPRMMGKNLLPSFTSNSHHSSSTTSQINIKSNVNNRTFGSVNFQNKISSPSSSCIIQQQPSTITKQRIRNENDTESGKFIFNPMITKPMRFNKEMFSPNKTDIHLNVAQTSTTPLHLCNRNPTDLENSNSKLVLSQSSQLTAEEQSLVESVFDGIDADSLFDDDF